MTTMIRRAVIYTRFSTEDQSSTAAQEALCARICEREGYVAVAKFGDEAKSGGTRRDRPGLEKALAMIARGEAEVLVSESSSRVTRKQRDIHDIYERVTWGHDGSKPGIWMTLNGKQTPLLNAVNGIVDEAQLINVRQNTQRTLRDLIDHEGKIPHGPCYGYRQKLGAEPGIHEIDETTSKVVLRIFQEYASGRTPREIAAGLNADGIPSPSGRQWSHPVLMGAGSENGALRPTRLMSNRLYIGEYNWGRTTTKRHPHTDVKTKTLGIAEEFTRTKRLMPHLRIISDDLWEAAHAIRRDRARTIFGPEGRPAKKSGPIQRKSTLLSGLLRCPKCSGDMIIVCSAKERGDDGSYAKVNRFACATAISGREGCDHRRSYSQPKLEREVLLAVDAWLADPRGLNAYLDQLSKLQREDHRKARSDLAVHERELTNTKAEHNNLMMFVQTTVLDQEQREQFADRMSDLWNKKKSLEAIIAMAGTQGNVVKLHDGVVARHRRSIATLKDDLPGGKLKPESAHALRTLVQHVQVSDTPKHAPYKVAPVLRSAALVADFAFFDRGTPEVPSVPLSKKGISIGYWSAGQLEAA